MEWHCFQQHYTSVSVIPQFPQHFKNILFMLGLQNSPSLSFNLYFPNCKQDNFCFILVFFCRISFFFQLSCTFLQMFNICMCIHVVKDTCMCYKMHVCDKHLFIYIFFQQRIELTTSCLPDRYWCHWAKSLAFDRYL